MLRFGSLRMRIIVLTTIPLIAILVTILFSAFRTATHTVRGRVQESLAESGSVFVQMLTSRRNELVSMAQVTVRDPRFFAPFSIPAAERGAEFRPTVEGIATDFLRITDADFMEIIDPNGAVIVTVSRGTDGAWSRTSQLGDTTLAAAGRSGIKMAMRGAAVADFYQAGDRIVAAAVAPVYVAHNLEAIIRLGSFLDEEFVAEVKRLTGADACLARDGVPFASTFPERVPGVSDRDAWHANARVASTIGRGSVTLSEAFSQKHDNREFLTIHIGVAGVDAGDGFDVFIARELEAEMAPIVTLEKRLAFGGLAAVCVTLLVGFLVAQSITGPLSRIVHASAALQKGEYNYPVDMRGRDELALLGKNFAHMRESLQSYVQHLKNLDQAKSNFIALAGHELRTPLTIITGFNEMIASGALGEVPDKMRETTTLITDQLTGLNRLVQSMLDLTYYEQDLASLHFSRRDIRELVKETALGRRTVAESRKLRLVLELGEDALPVMVDIARFGEALLSLVDNAIRFTPDSGTVRITTKAIGEEVHIAVEDTGIGIAQHELKWIFEKIYEVGDVMNHSSGTFGFGSKGFGLGLALCKVIVDKHGGRVLVTSAPGRGSTFTIVLPRSAPGANQPATSPENEGVLV